MTQGSAMLLLPNQITAAMITTGTSVPVVDSARGEVAWSSATSYTGVESKINDGGKLWAAVAASTNVKPGTDSTKWRETGPSNRMAAFDDKLSTRSVGAGELKLVIKPGFFNGLALYGLVGEQLEITLRNTPGGTIIYQWIGDMFEQPFGLFEYLYMPLRQITKRLAADLARQPSKLSFSNRLRKGAGLDPVKVSLLRECNPQVSSLDPTALAAAIKSVAIPLQRPRPIAEVISSAGGVTFDGIDERFMLTALPGTFVAGEMLDWEAPTGGYLLTACMATGRAAAQGMLDYLKS